jgi:hypothetical protein
MRLGGLCVGFKVSKVKDEIDMNRERVDVFETSIDINADIAKQLQGESDVLSCSKNYVASKDDIDDKSLSPDEDFLSGELNMNDLKLDPLKIDRLYEKNGLKTLKITKNAILTEKSKESDKDDDSISPDEDFLSGALNINDLKLDSSKMDRLYEKNGLKNVKKNQERYVSRKIERER